MFVAKITIKKSKNYGLVAFIDENHTLFKYSHIKFISDYSIIQTIDGNILCIGGATSIDRVARILNKSYWDNENIIPIGDEEK